jgi:hypothetical protein
LKEPTSIEEKGVVIESFPQSNRYKLNTSWRPRSKGIDD